MTRVRSAGQEYASDCLEGNVAGTAPHRTGGELGGCGGSTRTPTCLRGITELPSRASDGLTPSHAARVGIVIFSWTACVHASASVRLLAGATVNTWITCLVPIN